MPRPLPSVATETCMSVIGVGGGGASAVKCTAAGCSDGIAFGYVDTDIQALRQMEGGETIEIGRDAPRRTFVGPDIESLRNEVSHDSISIGSLIDGADLVFVIAALGGCTGSAIAPSIGRRARDSGSLTIGIATIPFTFEGRTRREVANAALRDLANDVDTLIVASNDWHLRTFSRDATLPDAYQNIDIFIAAIVNSIEQLVYRHGLIMLEFVDIRILLQQSGFAAASFGTSSGP